MKETILITGANGQIGTVLAEALEEMYGADCVLPTDIRAPQRPNRRFELLDVLDSKRLSEVVRDSGVTQIYHLAAILSAKGELAPQTAWDVNMNSLFNVLGVAREYGARIFFPSSIAVFGTQTPQIATPQYTTLFPETVYGISKVAGEYWCYYFCSKYGVDVRSLRYPGIIGYQSLPGGGTTDYAVEIFHRAVAGEAYTCFLSADTRLPMMYMPDAIRATLELMAAPAERLTVRTSYNLAGMSFTPREIAAEIRRHIPEFEVTYQPDFRQRIADAWSDTIDDSVARRDWGWRPEYDLQTMTRDMLEQLGAGKLVDGALK